MLDLNLVVGAPSAIVVTVAAFFAARRLILWLRPVRISPGVRVVFDESGPDQIVAAVTNVSGEDQVLVRCCARSVPQDRDKMGESRQVSTSCCRASGVEGWVSRSEAIPFQPVADAGRGRENGAEADGALSSRKGLWRPVSSVRKGGLVPIRECEWDMRGGFTKSGPGDSQLRFPRSLFLSILYGHIPGFDVPARGNRRWTGATPPFRCPVRARWCCAIHICATPLGGVAPVSIIPAGRPLPRCLKTCCGHQRRPFPHLAQHPQCTTIGYKRHCGRLEG